jgi:catechol 2,3-dioxygenase-like lactoylglutathione lyase family enzyme
MIKMVKFVSIPTSDQDRALDFWTTKMGFRVVTDQPMGDGQRWIELGIPGAETGVVLFTPEGHEDRIGGFFNGSFACDDVDYSYRQLSERGVVFDGPPEKQPWGHFAKFRDPDGNQFVLSSR